MHCQSMGSRDTFCQHTWCWGARRFKCDNPKVIWNFIIRCYGEEVIHYLWSVMCLILTNGLNAPFVNFILRCLSLFRINTYEIASCGYQFWHFLHTGTLCKNWTCFSLFPSSVWLEIVFYARQTCEQQTKTLYQTKLLCYNNTVCCGLIFE